MSENRPKQIAKRKAPRTAFKPGQSGNPGGRPAKTEEMRRIEDMAKAYSAEALTALRLVAAAGSGAPSVAAAVALLDRAWGRPIERQESGDPGAFNASNLSDEEVQARKRRLLERAIKSGAVSIMPVKKLAQRSK